MHGVVWFAAMYQLLSRGPADVLLDQCVDFWDGTAVRPLTGQERCICLMPVNDYFMYVGDLGSVSWTFIGDPAYLLTVLL